MLPFATIGYGGRIYCIKGSLVVPVNNNLCMLDTATSPQGGVNVSAVGADYYNLFWGGENSYYPGGYANHKLACFYHSKLYESMAWVLGAGGRRSITRFDGSGIFVPGGTTNYTSAKWKSGRGSELLSPSGAGAGSIDIRGMDLAMLEHKGVLFAVGQNHLHAVNLATSNWIKKCGWHIKVGNEGAKSSADMKNRAYRVFYIHYDPVTKKERKGMSPLTRFNPFAKYGEHLNACDAISYGDQIYYANWIDTLRFPGGSGTPILVECASGIPSAKSFAIFPTSGYLNGASRGTADLFMLTSSGCLKKVNPSNTTTIYDMKWKRNDIRTGHNMTRIESASAEPGRSALLVNYNKKLHAFIISATSGYRHLVCDGPPVSGICWTEKTNDLPEPFRRFDGNAFGYVDNHNNKLYVAHASMSEIGVCGHHGAQKSAGGFAVYEYNSTNTWRTINESMPGDVCVGLYPLNNVGPSVMAPSGNNPQVVASSDYAIVTYTLFDHYSRNVDVDIEYSIDDELTWHSARRFKSYTPGGGYLGDAIINLSTSHHGINHTFYWNYVADIGFNSIETCKLRITPRLTR